MYWVRERRRWSSSSICLIKNDCAWNASYPHCVVDAVLGEEVIRVEPSPVRLPDTQRSVSRCRCLGVTRPAVPQNRHFASPNSPWNGKLGPSKNWLINQYGWLSSGWLRDTECTYLIDALVSLVRPSSYGDPKLAPITYSRTFQLFLRYSFGGFHSFLSCILPLLGWSFSILGKFLNIWRFVKFVMTPNGLLLRKGVPSCPILLWSAQVKIQSTQKSSLVTVQPIKE